MNMYNPPHPGEFIKETYLAPYGLSVRYLASHLKVSPSTINRLINGESSVTPEMALRLSETIGRSAESWLAMQAQYDLWVTKQPKVKKIDFTKLNDAA
ncbi:MAG: addiction module antidote protein, HigA family [Gammaproteobacteria bacterium CG11_big_fil_rev_8_21_14_0_20_46_22]|nr:MAG: addiction module antidote protein, HigA family [Gammaproteobacteria bacterium CG12_big_fil_rev_8_21_14_0_65_46_12]PIR11383.1 MAG: addiction module antidote protein, HigA family [Gammaproteobacteria bacterium CG11_big_fil_rev_8_21_14_0_20_46_22]